MGSQQDPIDCWYENWCFALLLHKGSRMLMNESSGLFVKCFQGRAKGLNSSKVSTRVWKEISSINQWDWSALPERTWPPREEVMRGDPRQLATGEKNGNLRLFTECKCNLSDDKWPLNGSNNSLSSQQNIILRDGCRAESEKMHQV